MKGWLVSYVYTVQFSIRIDFGVGVLLQKLALFCTITNENRRQIVMKKFAKLFVVALVVTIFASLFAISSSAAIITVDAGALKPGSDSVVFVMDPDAEGNLIGNGDGTSAENPLRAIDHEKFDPEKSIPDLHLQTSFYQATELLKDTGGTVVICGPVRLGREQSTGNSDTAKTTFTAKNGSNTIKFTSVYNGVDYRETNGAKLILDPPAEIGVNGQTIWENIDIVTGGPDRKICFHAWATLFGEGVNCYPENEMYNGVTSYYLSISGGHRYEGKVDMATNMVIRSGKFNVIAAGIWGVNNMRKLNDDGTTNWTYNMDGNSVALLVLEGTTEVYGEVVGTTKNKSEFSGTTSVIINSGKYSCDINLVGQSGMLNTNGQAMLKVNGGDFSSCWSINPVALGYLNNAPAVSTLDFTGWKGENASLAKAYNLAANAGFTRIMLPEGVTADQLANQVETTVPTPVETTAPTGEATTAPNGNGGAIIIGGGDEETDASVNVNEQDGGSNLGLIIGIAVGAVVVIAAVVIVIVVLKKKKAK